MDLENSLSPTYVLLRNVVLCTGPCLGPGDRMVKEGFCPGVEAQGLEHGTAFVHCVAKCVLHRI